MKHYEEVAAEALRRRDEYDAQRKQKKESLRRGMMNALVVLIVVVAVGVVGVAAGYLGAAEYFKQYFEKRIDSDLSEEQQKIVSENVLEVNQSVTSDDITMTVEYVLRSGSYLMVRMNVQYPDRLDVMECNFGDIELRTQDGKLLALQQSGGGGSIDWDVEKNTGYYTIVIEAVENPYSSSGVGIPYIISDETVVLTFSEIFKCNIGPEGAVDEVLSDGGWRFEFTFGEWEDNSLELAPEPITVEVQSYSRREKRKVNGVIEISSLKLNEMSLNGIYKLIDGDLSDLDVVVVLKNGTKVKTTYRAISNRTLKYQFKSVIALDEVDYILLGGYKNDFGKWVGAARIDIPQN